MSKAEERALEYYPNIDREDYPCKELDAATEKCLCWATA